MIDREVGTALSMVPSQKQAFAGTEDGAMAGATKIAVLGDGSVDQETKEYP